MFQKLWSKIRGNHLLLMVICCLVPAILIIVLLPLFKENWIWLIILLCPLLHIFMMKGHTNHNDCGKEKEDKK